MEFSDIEKIDAHMHYSSKGTALLEQAANDKFSFISINTDIRFFDSIGKQEEYILTHNASRLHHIATFEMADWGKPGWLEKALSQIKQGISNGAIAIKFWKNIGMDIKDNNGNFLMLDDPSFQPIFEYLIANNIPAIGHLGDPKNCWLPLDEMTVNSDRAYFKKHPEFHMALDSECPSYEEQMEARDNVLNKNPNLRFVGAHLASLEWNVDMIGDWLDRFPNAAVDLAERVSHLQLQAMKDWQKVRSFMVKYQDRILYGSDVIYDEQCDSKEIRERTHRIWKAEWDFFATDKDMESPQFSGKFKGLGLADQIINKIYRENALNLYPKLNNKVK